MNENIHKDILEIFEESLSIMSNEKLLELLDKYKYTNFEIYNTILEKLTKDRIKIESLHFYPNRKIEGCDVSEVEVVYSVNGVIYGEIERFDNNLNVDPFGLLTIAYNKIMNKEDVIKNAQNNN